MHGFRLLFARMAMPIGSPAQRRIEELAPLGEATYQAWSAWAVAARHAAADPSAIDTSSRRPIERLTPRPEPA
jgi:hypothetical protein